MNTQRTGSSTSTNPTDQPRSDTRPPTSTTRTLLSLPTPHESQGASPDESNITFGPHFAEGAHLQPRTEDMERERRSHATERSSPSASSSQGDMADTEMEAGPSQHSEPSEPAQPPPKKKRTRTLTTAHQSAVLHALLAQSRFPTTAMREEVGRSIGLSARKVQIWFQNQRQKARRPRGQSAAPLTRPPQYGPFSNVPSGMGSSEVGTSGSSSYGRGRSGGHSALPSIGELSRSVAGPSGTSSVGAEPFTHPDSISQRYARSMSLSQLSGPGIPGPSTGFREQYPLPREVPSMVSQQSPRTPGGYPTFNTSLSRSASRPSTATDSLEMYRLTPRPTRPIRSYQSNDTTPMHGEFPIILPPIVTEPRHSTAFQSGASESGRNPTLAPISSIVSTGTPSSAAVVQRSRFSQQESPPVHQPAINIPPPFTLQPQPQWDDPAFSPFSRPSIAPSTRPSTYHSHPAPGYAVPHTPDQTPIPGGSIPSVPLSHARGTEAHPYAHASSSATLFDRRRSLHEDDHPESRTPRPASGPFDDKKLAQHRSNR
ncbi:hypothetical protein SCP_0805190 [Sparassis crispa]|uniref:Homeobox domain-containing protein n=1 Tax=Sparassis crispa TaxID=139825 RepID=A0A401GUT9_9APHY|nr:hypothetical protein SCP_0805190 [Sparassis crispa]GBE85995.1 hypothetical protein SCP_0805190 [Sparassis crispa]